MGLRFYAIHDFLYAVLNLTRHDTFGATDEEQCFIPVRVPDHMVQHGFKG